MDSDIELIEDEFRNLKDALENVEICKKRIRRLIRETDLRSCTGQKLNSLCRTLVRFESDLDDECELVKMALDAMKKHPDVKSSAKRSS